MIIKKAEIGKVTFKSPLDLMQKRQIGAIVKDGNLFVIPSPRFVERLQNYFGNIVELSNFFNIWNQEHNIPFTTHPLLRPYQEQDVAFLVKRTAGANLSEPRTGKTPTMLDVIENLPQKAVVISPPALLKMSWVDKIPEWTTRTAITTFKTKKKKSGELTTSAMTKKERLVVYNNFFNSEGRDILVLSRDTWKSDYQDFFDNHKITVPFTLVVDEAHYLRNHHSAGKTTKQCKGVLSLRKYATNAYAMTGTPSANHPSDIFGILHFLYPDRYKSFYDFVEYFWGMDKRFGWKPKPNYWCKEKEEELVSLVSTYSVMHKQKEVMPWLPPIIKEVVAVDMIKAQKDAYFDYFVNLKHKDDFIPDVLSHIAKLRVVSNAWKGEDGKIYSGKIDFVKEYLAENETEKILILSFYSNKSIPLIAESLQEYNPEVLTGANKENVPNFIAAQDDEYKRVFIANTQVIKEGLTMDKIDTIIFFDRMFNPDDNTQAENRFMPTTVEDIRDKEKVIIDLISTLPLDINDFCGITKERLKKQLTDEKILDMLNRKESITAYLNNLGKSWIKEGE